MPERVEYANGDRVLYLYAADGSKFRSSYVSGTDTVTVSYFGNAVYEEDVLLRFLTSDGYVTVPAGTGIFHYSFCDHQGNVRAVFSPSGAVEETTGYYPFGGLMSSSTSPVQPLTSTTARSLTGKAGWIGMTMGRDIMMRRWGGL